ncbi:MAG: M23 family metallopeptidase [Bacteroidota bacterium]
MKPKILFNCREKREINAPLSRGITSAALVALVVIGTGRPAGAARHPWTARKPSATPTPAHQLRDVGRWPAEPAEPAAVDPARFRVSVSHLCERYRSPGAAPDEDPTRPFGDLVQAAATEAKIDPFLLAGLMFAQSGCRPDLKSRQGFGLLRIHPDLYRSPDAPRPPGDKEDWKPSALLDAAKNLRLGAKLLAMWRDSHEELDTAFGGVPHRGPVAHFIWGDIVRGSGLEDQALTARRRLIAYYEQKPEPTTTNGPLGLALVSPLEGTPRLASSGPGEDRAGGKRRHRGIDLSAAVGEPIRAVADGTVMFAGANLVGAPRRSVTPDKIARYRWRRLGAGGIYVCIEHAPDHHVVTCYMHLDTYSVTEGDTVTAGQYIGRVGRTGVHVSPPHLHFELRIDDRCVDPTRHLAELVIPPKATQTYKVVMKAQRLRIAKARGAKASAEKL